MKRGTSGSRRGRVKRTRFTWSKCSSTSLPDKGGESTISLSRQVIWPRKESRGSPELQRRSRTIKRRLMSWSGKNLIRNLSWKLGFSEFVSRSVRNTSDQSSWSYSKSPFLSITQIGSHSVPDLAPLNFVQLIFNSHSRWGSPAVFKPPFCNRRSRKEKNRKHLLTTRALYFTYPVGRCYLLF